MGGHDGPPGLDTGPLTARETAVTPGDISGGVSAHVSAITPMMALGQFRDTFIIAVDPDGIAIIDQHVAHERILFERITERLASGRLESQRLLVPLLIEMSSAGRQALADHAADLERLGFEVEDFGGDALRVNACPALLQRDACDVALRAMAEDLEGLDRGAGVESAIKRIAATMADSTGPAAAVPASNMSSNSPASRWMTRLSARVLPGSRRRGGTCP